MPKTSKAGASQVRDFGLAEDRSEVLDDVSVSFITILEAHDLAGPLATLPGGRCPCPHWGYVLKGRITVKYEDREEVYETGDAFCMTPGHVPGAEAGTEFVQFSPATQLAEVQAAMMKAMQSGT